MRIAFSVPRHREFGTPSDRLAKAVAQLMDEISTDFPRLLANYVSDGLIDNEGAGLAARLLLITRLDNAVKKESRSGPASFNGLVSLSLKNYLGLTVVNVFSR
jgi:hypothetical protein